MKAHIYCKKMDGSDRISHATFKATKDSCGDLVLEYALNTISWLPCSRLEHFSLTKAFNDNDQYNPKHLHDGSFIVHIKSKEEMQAYKLVLSKAGYPFNGNWMGPDKRWARWYGVYQGEMITFTPETLPMHYDEMYEVYNDIGDLVYDFQTDILRKSNGSSRFWLGSPRRDQATIRNTTEETLINKNNNNNQIKTSTNEQKTKLFTETGSSSFGREQQKTSKKQGREKSTPIEGRLIGKFNRSSIVGRVAGVVAERRGY